jgi:hypothetical protein
MRREWSRVSFLMCPFCVRAPLLALTTPPGTSALLSNTPSIAFTRRGMPQLYEPRTACGHPRHLGPPSYVSSYPRGLGARDATKRSTVSSGSMLR